MDSSIDLPENLNLLGNGIFSDCVKLSSIELPPNIDSIWGCCFYGCTSLTTITIPSKVYYIYNQAFDGCKNLSLVISKIMYPPRIDETIFSGIPSNAILQVPKGTRNTYLKTNYWKFFFKEIVEEGCCNMSIKASGNGMASYDGVEIRNKSISLSVETGSNPTVSFTPDNGYRIKSLIVNGSDVTSSVSNYKYTVNNIRDNTTMEVEFEAITHRLTITALGNGYVTYIGSKVRNMTSCFTANEGTNASIIFNPDNGYRIKSLKVGSMDVTASVSNNRYTVSNIQGDTTVTVEFEAIPIQTYTLTISATGNGPASYNNQVVRNETSTFTVNERSNASIIFNPDNGYRIKSLKVGSMDVTASVSNNRYTVSNIQIDTTVTVEFETIPIPTYTLTISATGNGSASYNNQVVRNETSTFTVNEGSNALITFISDSGYRIKSIRDNNLDVTEIILNNSYSIINIQRSIKVSVEFEEVQVQKGDVNGDGIVDVADIAVIIDVMAAGDKIVEQVIAADVNCDGVVDVADIATVIDVMASSSRLQQADEEE